MTDWSNDDTPFSSSSAQSAARGMIDMFKKGESASIWLVRANEAAEDITSHILKADADIAQVIAGPSAE